MERLLLDDPLGLGRGFARLDNIDGGASFGTEIELEYTFENLRVLAWYAYNDFQEDRGGQSIRAFRPAQHKAGLTGRILLPDDWTFNANYKYSDTTQNDPLGSLSPGDVPIFHRFDLTVTKRVADGRGELMVGVQDLLDDTDQAIAPIGSFTAHETPGRMFFVRLQLSF